MEVRTGLPQSVFTSTWARRGPHGPLCSSGWGSGGEFRKDQQSPGRVCRVGQVEDEGLASQHAPDPDTRWEKSSLKA